MLKKYLRSTIIVLTQIILPVTALALLTPYLVQRTDNLHTLQVFLSDWNLLFLSAHSVFYCLLFFMWPAFVRHLCHQRLIEVDASEAKQAIIARWYLLSAFILFELLMLWR